ncbi:aminomethyltransferase family protein [Haloplanus sp. GCM10025708]|uniref:CAF17-like 4Fe-4S cluster assembly/insertion protein YgfZ n=1 Tax=Haloferacaceae TaxID=1644056 RepID=UPI003612F3DE
MTALREFHADHGAEFETRGGRELVAHYGRPARTHEAVRNGVGVVEMHYGVVVVEGDDRREYVDNAVSNAVPASDGEGRYALLLDPQGKVRTDMYVYDAGERLLVFVPPSQAEPLVAEWREKVFIQDVEIRDASDEFAVFGVHGPQSTEKVASVLTGAGSPEPQLSFVRGSIGDAGVTAIAADAPTGEEGYEIVCAAADARDVFDALLFYGNPSVPFGHRTWETLTTEAGTPLFETELEGRIPNVLGIRNAIDFEKGCFVGQEVVSRVENRGRPSRRLVGLRPDRLPAAGAAVFDGDESVGDVTRAVDSPSLGAPIALALVDFDAPSELTVRVDGEAVPAPVTDLPFVEGSDRSARLPQYGAAE